MNRLIAESVVEWTAGGRELGGAVPTSFPVGKAPPVNVAKPPQPTKPLPTLADRELKRFNDA
eukprot:3990439-Prymnesium_polylepis.1